MIGSQTVLAFSNPPLHHLLVAEDLEDHRVKVFSVPRMLDVLMTASEKSEEIHLRFSKRIAPYVKERGWHPSQRVIASADGSIEVMLNVAMTPELVQWVLGFGNDAKVLQPVGFAAAVVEAAEGVLRLYHGEGSGAAT